ncbi:MAG: hypothetical protein EPO00_12675, partial [Chloroflexota bacterium]
MTARGSRAPRPSWHAGRRPEPTTSSSRPGRRRTWIVSFARPEAEPGPRTPASSVPEAPRAASLRRSWHHRDAHDHPPTVEARPAPRLRSMRTPRRTRRRPVRGLQSARAQATRDDPGPRDRGRRDPPVRALPRGHRARGARRHRPVQRRGAGSGGKRRGPGGDPRRDECGHDRVGDHMSGHRGSPTRRRAGPAAPDPEHPARPDADVHRPGLRVRWRASGPGRRLPVPMTVSNHGRYATELAVALDLAARAGELQMAHYERLEQIDYKSARDVVTEADHLSEALILDGIRAAFPGDALMAEETGEHDAAAGEAASSGVGRVWVVDPLDGTINYANGIPVFCVAIALVVDGVPVVGVIRDPTRHESFAATIDGPATL